MDLVNVADELYGLPPNEFTATRDARAAEAKSAGDLELSRSIKQLRRPTISAWLANLLMRSRAAEIAELLDLGESMRQAQSELAAGEMRALSEQRRRLVAALAAEAKKLAVGLGQQANDATIEELEATLEAALADPAASDSIRSGHLTKALRYSGFGPVDLTDAVAAPGLAETSKSRPRRSPASSTRPSAAQPKQGQPKQGQPKQGQPKQGQPKQDRRTEARLALRDAESAAARAERTTLATQQRLDKATRERDRVFGLVAKMEKQLEELRESADRVERTRKDAQKAHAESERSTSSANARVRARTRPLDHAS